MRTNITRHMNQHRFIFYIVNLCELRNKRDGKNTKASNANSGENEEVLPPQDQEQGQDEGDFKCEAIMRRISALAWSSELRNLPEMNFIQLYDYMHLIFSTRNIGTSF